MDSRGWGLLTVAIYRGITVYADWKRGIRQVGGLRCQKSAAFRRRLPGPEIC